MAVLLLVYVAHAVLLIASQGRLSVCAELAGDGIRTREEEDMARMKSDNTYNGSSPGLVD